MCVEHRVIKENVWYPDDGEELLAILGYHYNAFIDCTYDTFYSKESDLINKVEEFLCLHSIKLSVVGVLISSELHHHWKFIHKFA